MEEEGIAELFMEDNAIADVASKEIGGVTVFDDLYQMFCFFFGTGPGTSLRRPPGTASHGISQGIRPLSQSGRPLSGFIRPGTQGSRPKTMEQAIMTPRTAMTARYMHEAGICITISYSCSFIVLPTPRDAWSQLMLYVTDLFVHDSLSSSGYPVIIYTNIS